jgi:hypothetical protein
VLLSPLLFQELTVIVDLLHLPVRNIKWNITNTFLHSLVSECHIFTQLLRAPACIPSAGRASFALSNTPIFVR